MSKSSNIYISSGKNIKYVIPKGLIDLLASVSTKSNRDVWLTMSEFSNVCISRLELKKLNGRSYGNSRTTKIFPGTTIELRYSTRMSRLRESDNNFKYSYRVVIKINKYEQFTQQQVDDYIVEGILLGDGLEVAED